jgi:cellulose/xylan binding protein with CBM9 domain
MFKQVSVCVLAFCCIISFPALAQGSAATPPVEKKLIEYGWDVPFPDFVRENIREMEKRPFDGLIFKLRGGGKVLTPKAWVEAQFTQDYEDLQNIAWDTFTHNFVIMWAASDQDWFSDAHWDAITNNAKLMAKAARLAKCAGICFDAEPYGNNPWLYPKAAHRDTKSFTEYEAIARKRGAQFAQAIEQEMPGTEILTFFQLSFLGKYCRPMDPKERAEKLSKEHYGLLPAFLQGMLEGSSGGLRIIDGNEGAYYYTNRNQYVDKYHEVIHGGLNAIDPALRGKYRAQVQMGQALYMDQYFGLRARKVLGHFMTGGEQPQWLEHNAYWALQTADKYVWCYSEKMDWWKGKSIPVGSEEALRSARAKIAAGQDLGFNLAPVVSAAQRRQQEALAGRLKDQVAEITSVPAGAAAPTINGVIDDAAWKSAKALEAFSALSSAPETVAVKTESWVTYDKDFLYIAIRCEEPHIQNLNSAGEKRDDYLFAGDVVEIFIRPSEKQARFYQFAVNPKGVIWDALHADSVQSEYNAGWKSAAHVGADFWSVEAAIPWTAMRMATPKPGDQFRANLGRERSPVKEWTLWSPSIFHFLEPENFGLWVFK